MIESKISIKKLDDFGKKEFVKLFPYAPKSNWENMEFYGAFDGDKLIGGTVININPDNFHYRSLGLHPEVFGEYLVVLKEYRNKRIGKELFKKILKYKKIGFKTGGMTTDIAKSMYEKMGFKVVKEKESGGVFVQYWYLEK